MSLGWTLSIASLLVFVDQNLSRVLQKDGTSQILQNGQRRSSVPKLNKKFSVPALTRSSSPIATKKSLHAVGKKDDIVGNTKDELPDFISHAIAGHHDDNVKWMDFYDNGASWDHFRAPVEHTNGYLHEDDGQYKVHLAVDDMGAYGGGGDHLNNMVEAYPGEIVSGENSLSRYVAPPVYDTDSYGYNRHKVHRAKANRLEYKASTPEQKSTEQENTKRLVDSLNSLMTPIKSHASTLERKFEKAMWGVPADDSTDQVSREVEEESQNQDRKALYEQTRLQESAKSRENLEKIEHEDVAGNFRGGPRGPSGKAFERNEFGDGQRDDANGGKRNEEQSGRQGPQSVNFREDYQNIRGDASESVDDDDTPDDFKEDAAAKFTSAQEQANDFEPDIDEVPESSRKLEETAERRRKNSKYEDLPSEMESVGDSNSDFVEDMPDISHADKASAKSIDVIQDYSGKIVPMHNSANVKEVQDVVPESSFKNVGSGEKGTSKGLVNKSNGKETAFKSSEGREA